MHTTVFFIVRAALLLYSSSRVSFLLGKHPTSPPWCSGADLRLCMNMSELLHTSTRQRQSMHVLTTYSTSVQGSPPDSVNLHVVGGERCFLLTLG